MDYSKYNFRELIALWCKARRENRQEDVILIGNELDKRKEFCI